MDPSKPLHKKHLTEISDALDKWDTQLDDLVSGKCKLGDLDLREVIDSNKTKIKPYHAELIKKIFHNDRMDAHEVYAWSDPAILEAYSFLDTQEKRTEFFGFFEIIDYLCDCIIDGNYDYPETPE